MLPASMVCRINGWSSTRNDFNNLWHTSGKKRSPKQTYAAYVAAWINSARPGLWKCIYWHGNVFILMTFSSLATLVAVRLTGSSAANDGNLSKWWHLHFSLWSCLCPPTHHHSWGPLRTYIYTYSWRGLACRTLRSSCGTSCGILRNRKRKGHPN